MTAWMVIKVIGIVMFGIMMFGLVIALTCKVEEER